MSKVALITGASGDIGQAIAKSLASHFSVIYVHFHQNKRAVEELMKEMPDSVQCIPVQSDLSKPDGVEVLLHQIIHPIDCVIYNSGSSYYGLITDMLQTEVEEMVQLHTTSPFLLIQKLLPSMIRKKSGRIVIISSVWGIVGASCEVLYSMVKGSQISFVKALAKEVAPSGITVNAVAPGAIDTKMLHTFSEEEKEELKAEIPAGELGTPSDVAHAVAFLIAEHAHYINGQVLSVNGAWY